MRGVGAEKENGGCAVSQGERDPPSEHGTWWIGAVRGGVTKCWPRRKAGWLAGWLPCACDKGLLTGFYWKQAFVLHRSSLDELRFHGSSLDGPRYSLPLYLIRNI